jgi:hypothetical protein
MSIRELQVHAATSHADSMTDEIERRLKVACI